MTRTVGVGDWVRFYQNGNLVLGVAEYISEEQGQFGYSVYTNIGQVMSDNILESRPKEE